MNEPVHVTGARSTATHASEDRLKVDAGKSKRKKLLKKEIKKNIVNKNKYDV